MATLPLGMVMAMVVDMASMDKHEEEKSEIFFDPAFQCSNAQCRCKISLIDNKGFVLG